MSPCFHRPWFCTAALGAPAATILEAMLIRPLRPVNPSPRPAARAAAPTPFARASLVIWNTVVVPVGSNRFDLRQGPGCGAGDCDRLGVRLVLAFSDSDLAGAVGPEFHVALGEGGHLGPAEASVGQDSDDGQDHGPAPTGPAGLLPGGNRPGLVGKLRLMYLIREDCRSFSSLGSPFPAKSVIGNLGLASASQYLYCFPLQG